MCSHKLSTSIAQAERRPISTPKHLAFSFEEDLMAVLFPECFVQIWTLNISREGGIGRKPLDPVLSWEGSIQADSCSDYRQICLLSSVPRIPTADVPSAGTWSVVCLASNSSEDLIAVNVMGRHLEKEHPGTLSTYRMPEHGGRLIPGAHSVYWQSPNGEVNEGEYLTSSY